MIFADPKEYRKNFSFMLPIYQPPNAFAYKMVGRKLKEVIQDFFIKDKAAGQEHHRDSHTMGKSAQDHRNLLFVWQFGKNSL